MQHPPPTPSTVSSPAPAWLSIQQAAEWAGLHHQTIRRAIDAGSLPATRPGGGRVYRIASQDLKRWMAGKPTKANTTKGGV